MNRRSFSPVFPGIALLACFAMIGFGCATKTIDDSDPASLYKDAEEEIQNDHYQLAIEKLRTIKNKFPYSKYSLDAQLRIADVLFLQESWAEAAASYETFRDLHPRHEKTPYAMFRVAKSYYNDVPDPVSRDMTPASRAQEAYNEFLRRFPTAPEAPEAQKDVATMRKVLAEKELYIGDFYHKRDFPKSAKPRYEKVVTMYPDTDAAKIARDEITKIDEKLSKEAAKEAEKAKEGEAKTP